MSRSLNLVSLVALLSVLLFSTSLSFQSDELLLDDDEFEGVVRSSPSSSDSAYVSPPVRRSKPDLDLLSSSDSKSVQFSLEHSFGGSDFFNAGTFTARIKSWSLGGHAGQTLTKLRFTRNALSDADQEAFKKLLEEDDFYTIRIPTNVLNPTGNDFVVSSVKARCLPRGSLDEHIIIHTDGVNVLAVNYGPAGACQYPRPLKFPAKWIFNSYTVLKNSEQAPKTPTFVEQLIVSESVLEDGVKPPEKSFWAKYWMYVIPIGFVLMNAMTQAMSAAGGEEATPAGQAARPAPTGGAVRRR